MALHCYYFSNSDDHLNTLPTHTPQHTHPHPHTHSLAHNGAPGNNTIQGQHIWCITWPEIVSWIIKSLCTLVVTCTYGLLVSWILIAPYAFSSEILDTGSPSKRWDPSFFVISIIVCTSSHLGTCESPSRYAKTVIVIFESASNLLRSHWTSRSYQAFSLLTESGLTLVTPLDGMQSKLTVLVKKRNTF